MRDRVTGRTRFVADYPAHGYLHATCIRLPIPRAAFTVVDTASAEAVPGVEHILFADDLAVDGVVPRFGPDVADQPVLAVGETRFAGEPIGVVLAETEEASRRAASLVDVTYEPLPPIMSRDAALNEAPLHTTRHERHQEWAGSNVMGSWTFADGDMASAQSDASVVIEESYSVPFAHHFAMEVPATLAMPEGEGVSVVSPIQHPFLLRKVIATMLGLTMTSTRVIGSEIGGSFGSKGYAKLEPLAAALALKLRRPIRIKLTAEEAFQTAQREASEIWMRTGFDETGRIVFQEMDADFLVGAYTDISARVVSKTGLHAVTPYRCDASRVTARALFTTSPPTTAFRGFGAPHVVFAVESQLDAAAHALGIDPVELRLINILPKGHPVPLEKPVDGEWGDLVRLTADTIGWDTPKPEGRGRGIALGLKSCVPSTSSIARVVVTGDGSVGLYVGTTEMGQGAHGTFGRIAADELGVDPSQVVVHAADTAIVPFDALTASSRSTVHMGNAIVRACEDIRTQVVALENDRQGIATAEYQDFAVVSHDEERTVTEIIGDQFGPGNGELIGVGSFTGIKNPAHLLNGPTPFYEVVATAVEIEIERETGMIQFHRIVHATDAGKILNHLRSEGLDEGGVVMGLGLALSEQMIVNPDTGAFANGSSLDYRIPTVGDFPPIEGRFLENEDGPGPYGSKGIAEGGVIAVAPAIAAAVRDCTGARITELPISPERLHRVLSEMEA